MYNNVDDGILSNSSFWTDVKHYASVNADKSFVDEVAYVMVTLHRTGA